MYEQVKILLKALENNKAPGADKMPAERLKYSGDEVVRLIQKLVVYMWQKECVPIEWRNIL
jgi:hypothetical protein